VERNVCRETGAGYLWVEWMNLVVSQFHIEQRLAAQEEK
jgi:hypothetical protein